MDLLINIKKSEDINRYIKYIEQKIKIAEDNNNLSEVKDLLKNKNFLEALYLYILDKKYKNEVPLLLEYANDIINDILELYVPLKEKIDKLVLDTNKSISINDMNTWLNNLFLIYKKHGKEITINDFKEIFPKSMEDDNKLIFEYMSIYFKNINNKDESIYNDAIFKYCTLSDDINNPVLNIMGKAIDTLNQKNNSYLEEEYNHDSLINNKNFKKFYDKEIKPILTIQSKIQYDNFMSYLNSMNFDKKSAIVDLGWKGTIQYS